MIPIIGRCPELIAVNPRGGTIRHIEVNSLPDLIDLLSKLAPIATAFVLSSVAEELESLIWNAAEDATRERDRRHPPLAEKCQS